MTHIRMLAPHEQRVVEEQDALQAKIVNLTKFLQDPNSKTYCSKSEYTLMTKQLEVMNQYSTILEERLREHITHFPQGR